MRLLNGNLKSGYPPGAMLSYEVIDAMRNKISSSYPNISLAGAISPPLRELTGDEINKDIKRQSFGG